MKLPEATANRLLQIAALMDGEAFTWQDGFCRPDGTWPKDSDFAHVRFVKLKNASLYLRELTKESMPAFDPCI